MKRWMAIILMFGLFSAVAGAEAKGRKDKAPAETAGTLNQAAPAPTDSESARSEAGAQAEQPRRPRIEKVDDATVRFLDEHGQVRKEIKLRKEERVGKVPSRFKLHKVNPDTEVRMVDRELAYPAPTGEYVAVVHEDVIYGDEYMEGGQTIKVYEAKTGGVILERDDITDHGVCFSENGQRVFFDIRNKEHPDDVHPDCLFVYDLKGERTLLQVNQYGELQSVRISPNGRYLVYVYRIPGQGAVLHDLDTGKIVQREDMFWRTKIFDDGTAELYKSDGYKDYLAERLSLK